MNQHSYPSKENQLNIPLCERAELEKSLSLGENHTECPKLIVSNSDLLLVLL